MRIFKGETDFGSWKDEQGRTVTIHKDLDAAYKTLDVMRELKKNNIVSPRAEAGNIVLAGHSGAFRVIAYILQNGQMPVQEVFLFDALYSQVDKYINWINSDAQHHFVHWFTNRGGGNGSIIGRNTFQRPKAEALAMLDEIIKIYKA